MKRKRVETIDSSRGGSLAERAIEALHQSADDLLLTSDFSKITGSETASITNAISRYAQSGLAMSDLLSHVIVNSLSKDYDSAEISSLVECFEQEGLTNKRNISKCLSQLADEMSLIQFWGLHRAGYIDDRETLQSLFTSNERRKETCRELHNMIQQNTMEGNELLSDLLQWIVSGSPSIKGRDSFFRSICGIPSDSNEITTQMIWLLRDDSGAGMQNGRSLESVWAHHGETLKERARMMSPIFRMMFNHMSRHEIVNVIDTLIRQQQANWMNVSCTLRFLSTSSSDEQFLTACNMTPSICLARLSLRHNTTSTSYTSWFRKMIVPNLTKNHVGLMEEELEMLTEMDVPTSHSYINILKTKLGRMKNDKSDIQKQIEGHQREFKRSRAIPESLRAMYIHRRVTYYSDYLPQLCKMVPADDPLLVAMLDNKMMTTEQFGSLTKDTRVEGSVPSVNLVHQKLVRLLNITRWDGNEELLEEIQSLIIEMARFQLLLFHHQCEFDLLIDTHGLQMPHSMMRLIQCCSSGPLKISICSVCNNYLIQMARDQNVEDHLYLSILMFLFSLLSFSEQQEQHYILWQVIEYIQPINHNLGVRYLSLYGSLVCSMLCSFPSVIYPEDSIVPAVVMRKIHWLLSMTQETTHAADTDSHHSLSTLHLFQQLKSSLDQVWCRKYSYQFNSSRNQD
ncbi:hypothetical protein PROFUN_03718 [Planoprotostelium fungivorum]|uniref:Uncharacterized protein n=1 Tax=Planoprotostelium fungivorum TaxID=1890364 RepID=A0A2P6NDJ9_9EUKA|nr:hypothetical protein PROFUN_03718 [Planoprotostelium fungivorum]